MTGEPARGFRPCSGSSTARAAGCSSWFRASIAPAIPAGHNLYLAALFELYVLGESRGIVEFNLGRGKQLDKLRLGANRFHLLFNYLRPEASQLESELLSLKEAAEKRAARELLELNQSTAMLTGV